MSEIDELIATSQAWLLRLCWLLTLDRDDASDLTQETLARAWREREALERHPDASAWLRRVAVNLCWDRSRRRSASRRRRHLVASPEATAGTSVEIDLHRAIGALPLRQRQVVVLFYWNDLDLAGCADAMDISVGSVKQHLARAKTALANSPELAGRAR